MNNVMIIECGFFTKNHKAYIVGEGDKIVNIFDLPDNKAESIVKAADSSGVDQLILQGPKDLVLGLEKQIKALNTKFKINCLE